MIFLTVGTQLPFDRLVECLDNVAPRIEEPIFAQVGNGSFRPKNFETAAFLSPDEYFTRLSGARVIVGHAGIGTILAGQKHRKPLVLMTRRHELGEHRNEHQVATANQISGMAGVSIFETSEELFSLLSQPFLGSMSDSVPDTRNALISNLRTEIFQIRY